MYIRHLGHSCFLMKNAGGVTVITDPYEAKSVGAPKINEKADIVTVSHEHYDHNAVDEVRGKYSLITGGGEWVVKGIGISGKRCFHDNHGGSLRGSCTIYKFVTDGLTICHMADLGEDLNPEIVDFVKGCDIMFIPVGGTYTIDADTATQYCRAINAKIVIPMHYLVEGLKVDVAPADRFLANMGGYRRLKELEVDADNIKMRSGVVYLQD
ncbi:MAG: MBL fold metallo-hydrolase [Clostridia bacterium]|nr:MBL fold metallo-hydrolase [Clostridia bacterium]